MTDYERTTTRETTVTDPTPTTRDAVPVRDTVSTSERAYRTAGPSASSVVARFVTFLFGILQAALILRIILLVLVANQGNDIVALILGITDPFVEPFRGMFALDRVTGEQGSTLDVAAVVALIGWTLIELLVLALLRIFDRREVTTV
ncbi:MAG: YggT family protein [Candidatus Limnocylindria bacterium]